MASCIAKCTCSLGTVSLWWARCTECIIWPMSRGKAIFYLRDGEGGEIAETRNAIVSQVLEYSQKHPVSHLFWVDDDVLVFPGCLLELLNQDRDIASGVYFSKLPGNLSEPLIFPEKHGGADRFRPNTAYDVYGHGMGLTLVRTSVYTRMRDELDLGVDKYGRPRWYHTSRSEEDVSMDEKGVIDLGWTEDLYFLGNAAKLGIKPRVVTTKHALGFHFDSKTNTGYPEKQWDQWTSGEPLVWDTPEGDVTWD